MVKPDRGVRRAFAALSMVSLAALAVSARADELLVNRSFSQDDMREWELCDPASDTTAVHDNGPTPCAADGPIQTGTWDVDDVEDCPTTLDNYSAALRPDDNENVAIRQRLITGELVGRAITISGCWRRSTSPAGADRKIKVTLAWKKEGGGYDETCTWTAPASTTTWTTFSFSTNCTMPGTSGTKMLSDSYLQIETVGTKGNIRIDDLSVSAAGSAATWSISCTGTLVNCRSETLASISSTKEIAAVSHRWNESGRDGFLIREVSVTDADGSNAVRVTEQPEGDEYGQIHPAVSPGRTKVAVVRFSEDWNGDGKYTTTIDPQSVWILDLAADKAYQLSPYWQDAGLAGFAWTSDSQYIYYSTELGRQTRIYKVKYDGTSNTLMSDTSLNAWESDVDLSRDGTYLIFHAEARNDDGTYEDKGKIVRMEVSEAPCGSCTTRAVLTNSPDSPQDHPNGSRLAVGDYDPQFSPDGTQILFWRNRVCTSPCNPLVQGWSIEMCALSAGCTNNANVKRLADGGSAGDSSDTVYLIPDWADPNDVPSGTQPIIVGHADDRTGTEYVGLVALDANDSNPNETRIQSSSCTGITEPDECDVWPRFIDR